ncbi:MAG: hypothetical protein U0350_25905 [Caldilineaceae bacterium]
MIAYEFSTEVTKSRTLPIPLTTAPTLQAGAQVRVILLVEEAEPQHNHNEPAELQASSLRQLVDAIKQLPQTPSRELQPESGLLGKHLVELEQEIDPTFDVEQWLQEWDQVEATIKRESLARESRILSEMDE